MLARVPARQFSLDPLIKEAKRRARQRRVVIAVGIALVAGAAAGAVLTARSPGGPGAGGGASLAQVQATFRGSTQPPVSAAVIAAAQRDAARLLRQFVPPPDARRVAYEPVLYRQRAKRLFGHTNWELGPPSSDKFARFAYWRVHSSVAEVARFERAHNPLGALSGGGYSAGVRKAAEHRSSAITFTPIQGVANNRWLMVWILRLPGHWTAIRAAVSNTPWVPRARRRALKGQKVFLTSPPNPARGPVAGEPFTGVEVIDANPRIFPLTRVTCGGMLGNRPLAAVQHVFATTAAPVVAVLAGVPERSRVEEVTCTWQIPADAAGKRLHLGTLARPGLVVHVAPTPKDARPSIPIPHSWTALSQPGTTMKSTLSWVVRR